MIENKGFGLSGKTINDIKKINRALVLKTLFFSGPKSRKFLADALELTPAAITNITAGLIEEGVLVKAEKVSRSGGAGRKEQLLDLNYRGIVFLSIDIQKDNFTLITSLLNGKSLSRSSQKFETDMNAQNCLVKILYKLSKKLNSEIKIHSIGISVAENFLSSKEEKESFLGALKAELINLFNIGIYFEKHTFAMFYADRLFKRSCFEENNLFLIADKVFSGVYIPSASGKLFNCEKEINFGNLTVYNRDKENSDRGLMPLNRCASFSYLLQNLKKVYSEDACPFLYASSKGDFKQINLNLLFEAYSKKDKGPAQIMDSIAFSLAQGVSACVNLLEPDNVFIYSHYFKSKDFLKKFKSEIRLSKKRVVPAFSLNSDYNKQASYAATALAILGFLENGA
ncbi:MAG: hypothetical protein GX345_04470 [Clostridiales bacterium]|nr:hypothetical protein [Clostridiales bacterium]